MTDHNRIAEDLAALVMAVGVGAVLMTIAYAIATSDRCADRCAPYDSRCLCRTDGPEQWRVLPEETP